MSAFPMPKAGTYPAFYDTYFKQLDPDTGILQQLQEDAARFSILIEGIADDKRLYAYAPGKWTVNQVIQHVVDTERIQAYRALAIARGEQQMLPGFDENAYAAVAECNHKPLALLALEWLAVRQASISLFYSLTPGELEKTGHANHNVVGVNALACMIVAHARHHVMILKERYL